MTAKLRASLLLDAKKGLKPKLAKMSPSSGEVL
jgi:hypothetical protein